MGDLPPNIAAIIKFCCRIDPDLRPTADMIAEAIALSQSSEGSRIEQHLEVKRRKYRRVRGVRRPQTVLQVRCSTVV